MKPIDGIRKPMPGYYVQDIDLNVALSNVVTTYLASNHRPTRFTEYTGQDIMRLLNFGLQPGDKWSNLLATGAEQWDVRKKLGALRDVVQELFFILQRSRVGVDDLAECDIRGLAELGPSDPGAYWSTEYVVNPALGYPRPWYGYRAPNPCLEHEYGAYRLPHPTTEWCKWIAASLLIFDRGRLDARLIPDISAFEGYDTKSMPHGPLMKVAGQTMRLHALAALYLVQGAVFFARVNERRLRREWDYTWSVDAENAKPALEFWASALDAVVKVPLHPLLAYIAAGLQTPIADGFYGDKELLIRVGRAPETYRPRESGCAMRASDFRDWLLAEAQGDYYCAAGAKPQRSVGPKKLTWNFLYTEGQAPPTTMSYGNLMSVIAGSTELTRHWDEIARTLNWDKQQTSPDVGTTRPHSADFIFTDGDSFTDLPAAVVLGLRPLMSFGNYKKETFVRRSYHNWNLSENRSLWSALPVRGRVGITPAGTHLEHMAIPAGMSMDESGALFATPEGYMHDRGAKQIVEYWATKQKEYWSYLYTDPSNKGVTPPDTIKERSWDPEGWTDGDPGLLQGDWLAAGAGQTESAKSGPYFMRNGDFKFRVPVRMSRPNSYLFFNENGNFLEEVPYQGHVMMTPFDDIAFSQSDATIEAIGEMSPKVEHTGSEELDKALDATSDSLEIPENQ